MWRMQSSVIIYLLQIFLFLVTSFNSFRPQGGVSEGIGAKLKSSIYMWIFYVFFSRREGAITRAVCAGDLRGISAPVTTPTFLSDSRPAGVTP